MQDHSAAQDWENLVKKQLGTDDISSALMKKNLEGITVKPYYTSVLPAMGILPKVEESTHLVSAYHDLPDENTYAFLIVENVEGLEDKALFINSKALASHISVQEENSYFSLVDVFDDNSGAVDENLIKILLEKDFKRKICADVAFHQNAGASIVQQLAFALAKSKELVEICGENILDLLLFRIAVGGNYFFEMAKIRALKLVVMQLAKEYGKASVPYIFAETSMRNKTAADEENNLIRSTFELAAAMIGGADAVFSNDYKVREHSALSQEISFKQQVVLAYESIINVFEDGAGGSYYIEAVTQQLAEQAWQLFLEIEDGGGYAAQLRDGKIQQLVFAHAAAEQDWVGEGKIKIVGANLYPKLTQTKNTSEMYSQSELKPVRWSEMFE